MRIRKKKNLESRLANCTNLITIENADRDFRNVKQELFDYVSMFGNNNPVHLEIGCGKGQFVCEMAKRCPEVNFIAIEKCANVVVQACEAALRAGLHNIIFVKMDAEYLLRYFAPESIDRIYLNFSCPFPKKSHETHRLTHVHFLEMYQVIMTQDAAIWQKTDNMHFFEFSVEQFSAAAMPISQVTFDLHRSGFEGNIETEYEKKFISQGLPIYRLEARKSTRSSTI